MHIFLRREAYTALAAAHGHYTYEQQAAASGLGIATIHRIRSGGPVSSPTVAAICSTYSVEFADLFVIATPARAAA